MEKKLYEKIRKTNAAAVELRERIEKVEREKEELEEKVKQMKVDKDEEREERWNNQMEEVLSVVKSMQGMMLERMVDINAVREEIQSLRTEIGNQRNDMEKNSSDLRKLTEDFTTANYEVQATVIESEERLKRANEEATARLNEQLRETEERLEGRFADRQQTVSTNIRALQEGVEQKQNENHLTILQRLAPLHDDVKFIKRQVDKDTILVLGGVKDGKSDEMVILKQDKWIKLALKLPKELRAGGAVYLDGEIYIFGGVGMQKELYKLDNKTLEWIRLADMNEGRISISNSCLEWNGSIWVFGGWNMNRKEVLKSVERYDPKENKWIKMPDMKYSRAGAAAAVHNGKCIVCGGYDGSNRLESVECFDPESGVWTEMNDMPTPLFGPSLVSHGNNLILMGGHDGKTVNTVLEVSNLEGKGTCKQLPPMKQPRCHFSAAVLDNEIFVIGGCVIRECIIGVYYTEEDLDKTEICNGKSWREGPQLPNGCREMSSIVIPQHLADILLDYK